MLNHIKFYNGFREANVFVKKVGKVPNVNTLKSVKAVRLVFIATK